MTVSGIARMNIAGLSDQDLAAVRGVVARAVAQDPHADEHGLIAALDEELALRPSADPELLTLAGEK